MARRVAKSSLNGSTIEILNVIRANASQAYQDSVPEVTNVHDIPKVGEVLYGNPAMANQFINALVNRIAMVRIKTSTFNNRYSALKKGYLEYGETVEEVFVEICKAMEFSQEKAHQREHKRYLPKVRSAFHLINWRVIYPVSVSIEELHQAFMSANGVTDLITKIINSVYGGAEYDEYLLFKYLLIKAISHGKMKPVEFDSANPTAGAVAFRENSNMLEFMSRDYNEAGVLTNTNKADQYIFMDAHYNAKFDVETLAGAFNMDKANIAGKLMLIDDWATFDNERFDIIRENSDGLEEVTANELAMMTNVKAVLVDAEWFQVYDNLNVMKEQETASGLYWNYFYHTWKTVSSSPFSNAIVFVDNVADTALPESFTVNVRDKIINGSAVILTLAVNDDNPALHSTNAIFVQNEGATTAGVAVERYGAIMFQNGTGSFTLQMTVDGVTYSSSAAVTSSLASGNTITMTKG